jgi:hypothetical protein
MMMIKGDQNETQAFDPPHGGMRKKNQRIKTLPLENRLMMIKGSKVRSKP